MTTSQRKEYKNQISRRWKFNKQVNVSVLVQLVFLAALIIGSWVNLQRQLCLLEHNVNQLLENQNKFHLQLRELSEINVEFEYRLRALENNKNGKKVY